MAVKRWILIWVSSAVTWIPAETWEPLADPDKVIPPDAPWYGGIDLGRSNDISSFALFFPEQKHLIVKHYVAEDAAEYAARGGIDYNEWIKQGHLIATPGKTTDYEYIREDVFEAASNYEARFIGIDPYSSQIFRQWLDDELGTIWAGVRKEDGSVDWDYRSKVQTFRQGFVSLGPATALFEEMVINGAFTHDGNPVTAWMLENVALAFDAAGNFKPTKEKSKDKIDGIVASIMALGEYSQWHSTLETDNNSMGVY
jgi:phage terminase large subunit-like protein